MLHPLTAYFSHMYNVLVLNDSLFLFLEKKIKNQPMITFGPCIASSDAPVCCPAKSVAGLPFCSGGS